MISKSAQRRQRKKLHEGKGVKEVTFKVQSPLCPTVLSTNTWVTQKPLHRPKHSGACGIIVFRDQNWNEVLILVSKKAGNYGFPKGGTETGETNEETAARELEEETGLKRTDVMRLDEHYIDHKKRNGRVGVRYFLGLLTQDGKHKPLCPENPKEVLEIGWEKFYPAIDKLKKSGRDQVLFQAHNLLNPFDPDDSDCD